MQYLNLIVITPGDIERTPLGKYIYIDLKHKVLR